MVSTEEIFKRYSSGSMKMFLECQSRLQEAMLAISKLYQKGTLSTSWSKKKYKTNFWKMLERNSLYIA